MIKDGQVRRLRGLLSSGASLALAARKAGMDEKTARKYRAAGELPSQRETARHWRTRQDPFAEVWPEVRERLEAEPSLRAFALFAWLQDQHPGEFSDSQRRTFERRVRQWRGQCGPRQEVMFPQQHHPGQLAASDFTRMNSLRVTIAGQPFDHLLYHFTLTYSNWESVSICFSESFEAFSRGFQQALWQLGGVPRTHRSDSLSAAVNNLSETRDFRARYQDLLDYYRIEPQRINVRKAHENGDVESSHGHLKSVIEQALLLRGSRDFTSRAEYERFLDEIIIRRNAARQPRFREEQQQLGELPLHELDYRTVVRGITVRSSSTIVIKRNVYSVHSRLIGHQVDVVIDADFLEVRYADAMVCRMPRLIGSGKHAINYRHVIDSLVRKPGAFEHYQYREDMFPTSHFRMAYDALCRNHRPQAAAREYLKILQLAARDSQDAVQAALRAMIAANERIAFENVRAAVEQHQQFAPVTDVHVDAPSLDDFDSLLQHVDKEVSDHDQEEDDHQDGGESKFTSALPAGRSPGKRQRTVTDADSSASRPEATDVSGTLHEPGRESQPRSTQSCVLSGGADGPGVPGQAAEPNRAADAKIATSDVEDLEQFRLEASAAPSGSTARKPARRIIPGSPGEHSDLRQTGLGKKSLPVRAGRAVGAAWTFDLVYDLQLAGTTVVDCQAGLAFG